MLYAELPNNAIFRFENDRDLYEKVSDTHYRRGVHQLSYVCMPIATRPEPVEPLTCENCDAIIFLPVYPTQQTQAFCSEECLGEAVERRLLAKEEARRQYEMFADDVDSWYT